MINTSPEMLVVAGRVGLHGEVLDVAEVLLEDKWTSVDPQPAPYYWMHITFHDRNLYFMVGGRHGTTVYTCSMTFHDRNLHYETRYHSLYLQLFFIELTSYRVY